MNTFKHIHDYLSRWALIKPNNLAYAFVSEDWSRNEITFSELYRYSINLSKYILSYTANTSNQHQLKALLLLPSGIDFVVAFYACLYAGVIAIPVSLPRKLRTKGRLENIMGDIDIDIILTSQKIYETVIEEKPDVFKGIKILQTDAVDLVDPCISVIEKIKRLSFKESKADDIAFLQYTSGTTGQPKGVVISHANILANQAMIKEAFNNDESTIVGGWLPLYHDMGLIGNILQPLYLGVPSYLMSPTTFLRNPVSWLRLISDFSITISGAPNFAYALCAAKVTAENKASLDLSSWQVAFNGAEHVYYKTLEDFSQAFKCCGFNKEVFYPCYGLAEATLCVSANDSGDVKLKSFTKNSDGSLNFDLAAPTQEEVSVAVSVGKPNQLGLVKIVNPDNGLEAVANQPGEICIAGSHVTSGYWGKKEINASLFYKNFNASEQDFLRTGDLGFLSEDDELYVLSRIKDLIIKRGKNIYPQDIENEICANFAEVNNNACAAFSVIANDAEKIVVVIELDRKYLRNHDLGKLLRAIRVRLQESFEIKVDHLVFVKPNVVPRTTSGKIQRSLCKALFLENKLSVLNVDREDSIAKISGKYKALALEIEMALDLAEGVVDLDSDLRELGLDSLTVISLQQKILDMYQLNLPVSCFYEAISLKDIINKIELANRWAFNKSCAVKTNKVSEQQKMLYYHQLISLSKAAYNLSRLIKVNTALNINKLNSVFMELIANDEMLKTSFYLTGNKQVNKKTLTINYEPIQQYSFTNNIELVEFLDSSVAEPFDLSQAPLIKIIVINIKSEQYLLLLAHHIICDLWSFNVFLKKLFTRYVDQEKEACLSYDEFINNQQAYLSSSKATHDEEYWKRQLSDFDPNVTLPTSYSRPKVKSYSGDFYSFSLGTDLSKKIKNWSQVNSINCYVLTLCYFRIFCAIEIQQDKISIGTTVHGRIDPNWHNIIGNFVNSFPFVIEVDFSKSFSEFVKNVKNLLFEHNMHSALPFSKMIELYRSASQTNAYDMSYSPLFQVMFVYQKIGHEFDEFSRLCFPSELRAGEAKIKVGDIALTPCSWLPKFSNFDFTMFMTDYCDILSGYIEYNDNLYNRSSISLFVNKFKTVVSHLVDNPQKKLVNVKNKLAAARIDEMSTEDGLVIL